MRILLLSPRQCWPAISGAKLREYYFARALGQHADLTCVHFSDPALPPPDLPFCRAVVSVPKPTAYSPLKIARGLTGRWPLPVLNYSSPQMAAALERLVQAQRYDLVHMESTHMVSYTGLFEKALGPVPIVYNWHNIESEAMRRYSALNGARARRIYAGLAARQMERLERSILKTASGHVVCSERERTELLTIAPQARIRVVPNGVDTAFFSGSSAPGAPRKRIVFVGLMSYYPNVEAAVSFARQVWPRLQAQLQGYSLTLVGANPTPAVLALREVAGVEVTGTVPDVRPYYSDALAAVVPLRTGGGTRLKILEAMASGVPVISTPLGAEGLEVEPGKNIILAPPEDSGAWVRELVELAQTETKRFQLISAAMELVRERYDWTILGERLVQTYREWLEDR